MHAVNLDRFGHIEHLKMGTDQQQAVYHLLTNAGLFDQLEAYDPLLVGTVPIDIAIATSDLDIVCCASDLDEFCRFAQETFSWRESFQLLKSTFNQVPTVLVHFTLSTFEVELFVQHVPSKLQHGYRHMIKEYEILASRGPDFRKQVLALKRAGLKTEPAFAKLLGLEGDPYERILNYHIHENI
ncbi:DUF4269 domain-containing protein [Sphingobacterium griseoflavum]|uniref:Alpha/beta hydrolase n=1 Tax=Sphingobacterium griseoflavum TaxID=1474952 RepID=A0ABQ3HUA7_9SPHI|nr:DUF4269 domain-containing protein [Sphingobacterium griseoflavum]GHE23052.1 alpha/beta hydrolase [Sphingobacterium griseoflavum]